jgi:hypothetical protein
LIIIGFDLIIIGFDLIIIGFDLIIIGFDSVVGIHILKLCVREGLELGPEGTTTTRNNLSIKEIKF